MSEQHWGPRERRAYLAMLDGTADGPGIFAEIAEAERVVAACELDWDDAVGAVRETRADAPDADLAYARELSPAARHRFVLLGQAQEHEARAADAYRRARARLDGLLATLEDLSRPDLGLPPGLGW